MGRVFLHVTLVRRIQIHIRKKSNFTSFIYIEVFVFVHKGIWDEVVFFLFRSTSSVVEIDRNSISVYGSHKHFLSSSTREKCNFNTIKTLPYFSDLVSALCIRYGGLSFTHPLVLLAMRSKVQCPSFHDIWSTAAVSFAAKWTLSVQNSRRARKQQ